MFGNEELENLQTRKRELVVQSGLHRALVLVECQNLRASLAGLERGLDAIQKLRPFWPVLAPILGYTLAGKRRAVSSLIKKVAWLCWAIRTGFAFREAWTASANRKPGCKSPVQPRMDANQRGAKQEPSVPHSNEESGG